MDSGRLLVAGTKGADLGLGVECNGGVGIGLNAGSDNFPEVFLFFAQDAGAIAVLASAIDFEPVLDVNCSFPETDVINFDECFGFVFEAVPDVGFRKSFERTIVFEAAYAPSGLVLTSPGGSENDLCFALSLFVDILRYFELR